ncbi:SipW-dependent-type signal peptide-containing protein [Paramicrobacterium agarici]|uniref:SipW-dependent-type signal peptide-containing protein n=1 Tax=Paramicrobacterium agarici TaxID=630514 RepID=UPI001153334F|nr:SipW-dependent-type signal peptide-containing protein [Microbacterium agarici]TQO22417.1 putative ribosomally synthesized peptide with SipW-like signal peptide [Microbacterium agarici]
MKRVFAMIAGVALVLVTGTGVTLALWNDSETIDGVAIRSGVLMLDIGGQTEYDMGTVDTLYPGAVTATRLELNGHASGNLGLDYVLTSVLTDTSSASSALFGVVDAQVYVQSSASAECATSGVPGGTQVYGAAGGYSDLAALSVTESLVSTTELANTDYLCVRLTIPAGTSATVDGVELSDATSSFILNFAGEGIR